MKRGGLGALAVAVGLLLGCGASQPTSDRAGAGDRGGADDEAAEPGTAEGDDGAEADDGDDATETAAGEPPATTESATASIEVDGRVISAGGGAPVAGAVVTAGERTATTDHEGRFTVTIEADGELLVRRPTFLPVTVEPGPEDQGLTITLEPVLARGVRVSRYVAADPEQFRDLLDLIDGTAVNTLVFDTKDESGAVLYQTGVDTAERLGSVVPTYRPRELLALATERGLYPITRVVTFEDPIWSGADPEAKLAGAWVDATDRANWDYPIALAIEACQLGFAEIQFDYVRYPAGRTARVAAPRVPGTADERSAVIAAFLAEARSQLQPLGCGVSAAVFGIVMSSETDEGIGQTVEAIGAEVDALSPMLYPSHYGPGWLGFADPNDHPGPVVADALDDGIPRLTEPIQMRPWIQAFFYNGAQIGAQISEAEARGAGWLLWNASGNYRQDWLPAGDR